MGRVAAVLSFTWLAYALLHIVLSGRWWLMLLPDLAPPLVFVLIPITLGGLSVLDGLPTARRRARRWIPVAACVAALVVGVGQSGLNFDLFERGGQVPSGALHVVSWNTEYWDQDDEPEAFYAYLRSFDADVYLLQEYLNWHTQSPVRVDDRDRLSAEFPGYSIATAGELLTLSRYPIISSQALDNSRWHQSAPAGSDFPDFWREKTLRTNVKIGNSVMSIYNVHIPVQLDLRRKLFAPTFFATVRQQADRRTAAWRALTADLAENSSPRLVAGDFNTTPAMGEMSHLDSLLTPARLTGSGLYPSSWDARRLGLWRLDFAYHDDLINIDRYNFRGSLGFSDHDAQDLLVSTTKGT